MVLTSYCFNSKLSVTMKNKQYFFFKTITKHNMNIIVLVFKTINSLWFLQKKKQLQIIECFALGVVIVKLRSTATVFSWCLFYLFVIYDQHIPPSRVLSIDDCWILLFLFDGMLHHLLSQCQEHFFNTLILFCGCVTMCCPYLTRISTNLK